jgi:hypothetical protein
MSSGLSLYTWVLAAVCAGLALPGCARRPPAAEQSRDTVSLTALRESIARQVEPATCSSPNVCRTLAMGAKPCGGPRRYLVYSILSSDSARLANEVARYNQAEERMNRERGLVSDCSVVVEPKVSCQSGKCAAVQSEAREVY